MDEKDRKVNEILAEMQKLIVRLRERMSLGLPVADLCSDMRRYSNLLVIVERKQADG